MPSQLNSVLCAAIEEFQTSPYEYQEIYRRYLGVVPPVLGAGCSGTWIERDEIDPASSLRSVLKRRKLRIGHVDAAPYVFRTSATELRGIDYEVGRALTALMAKQYPELDPEPEWVLVSGSYGEESEKFKALYAGLGNDDYDLAFSGQANIGSEIAEVDWLCATNLCFTNFLYTGRGSFDLGTLNSRDEVVAKLKTLGPITLSCVANNPGPSYPSALNLQHDIGDTVQLMESQGATDLNRWVANADCHFSIGDGIASSWLSLTQWPNVINFNLQVALAANPPQQVAGFTLPGV